MLVFAGFRVGMLHFGPNASMLGTELIIMPSSPGRNTDL